MKKQILAIGPEPPARPEPRCMAVRPRLVDEQNRSREIVPRDLVSTMIR